MCLWVIYIGCVAVHLPIWARAEEKNYRRKQNFDNLCSLSGSLGCRSKRPNQSPAVNVSKWKRWVAKPNEEISLEYPHQIICHIDMAKCWTILLLRFCFLSIRMVGADCRVAVLDLHCFSSTFRRIPTLFCVECRESSGDVESMIIIIIAYCKWKAAVACSICSLWLRLHKWAHVTQARIRIHPSLTEKNIISHINYLRIRKTMPDSLINYYSSSPSSQFFARIACQTGRYSFDLIRIKREKTRAQRGKQYLCLPLRFFHLFIWFSAVSLQWASFRSRRKELMRSVSRSQRQDTERCRSH